MKYLDIIYIVVSILSIILYVMSVQFKKKKDILVIQILASISYLIVYSIKGLWSGVASEVLEEVKDYTFIKLEKKYKKIPLYILIIFLIILFGCTMYFYDGPLSILPLVINLILFISTYFKNPKYIRIAMLICGMLWLIYNIYGEAYIICIGNILEIISATIALLRFKKKNV